MESAREGIVLLKNENDLLPLDKDIRSIAVIGPNAHDRENLLGDYIPKKLLYEAVTVREAIQGKVSPDTQGYICKGMQCAGQYIE